MEKMGNEDHDGTILFPRLCTFTSFSQGQFLRGFSFELIRAHVEVNALHCVTTDKGSVVFQKIFQMDYFVKQEVTNECHCRSGQACSVVGVQRRIPDNIPRSDSAEPPVSAVPILIGGTSAKSILD